MNKERNERESCLIWTLHPITTTLSSSSWSYLCFFVFFLLFLKMIDRILPCLNNTWDIFLQCLNITPGLRPPTPHFLFPSFVLSIKFYKGSIGGRLPQTTLFSYLLCLALSLGRFCFGAALPTCEPRAASDGPPTLRAKSASYRVLWCTALNIIRIIPLSLLYHLTLFIVKTAGHLTSNFSGVIKTAFDLINDNVLNLKGLDCNVFD